jgi:hypothetical protein
MRTLQITLAGLLVLSPVGSWSAAHADGDSPAPTSPAVVPAGVILVKGAWSSASDSTTPVPEGGKATDREYHSGYFHLTYPFAAGWKQKFAGPPPSDRGYYVLAQIEPADAHSGNVLIEAQDSFFAATSSNATGLVSFTATHLRADNQVERPPAEVTLGARKFARLDYVSAVTGLHRALLVTQIRCHMVQFTFTSTDPRVIDHLIDGMSAMTPTDEAAPICIDSYATGANVLNRVDPILTDRRFNSIPVRVVIDTSGKVKFIHFISSFPDQARTITDALQQWRFKPYVLNGKAVEVETGMLFGVRPNRPLISGKQDPQLPPARKHDTT